MGEKIVDVDFRITTYESEIHSRIKDVSLTPDEFETVSLRIWQDENSNGETDTSELKATCWRRAQPYCIPYN